MHPDLAALQTRYTELSQAASLNHISVEDATATLNALSVTDGAGAVWRIDVYGNFLRSAFPGAEGEAADASAFVDPFAADPSAGLGPQSSYDAQGFGAQQGYEAQNTFGEQAQGYDAPAGTGGGYGGETFSAPQAGQPHDPFAGSVFETPGAGFNATGADPNADLYRPANERPARSLSSAGAPSPALALFTRAKEFVLGNLIIVIVGLVVAVLLITHFTGSDGEKIPDKAPTASESTDPGVDPGVPAPDDTETETLTPDPTTAPLDPGAATMNVPSAADVKRVKKALMSGNRTQAAGLIASADPKLVAVSSALFAGLGKAGLTLDTGTPTAAEGGATAEWRISGDGLEPVVISVTWVAADGTWKLSQPPLP